MAPLSSPLQPSHAGPIAGRGGLVVGPQAAPQKASQPLALGDRYVASAPLPMASQVAAVGGLPVPAEAGLPPIEVGTTEGEPAPTPGRMAAWQSAVENLRTRLPVDGPRPWPEAPPDAPEAEPLVLDELPPEAPAAPVVPPAVKPPLLPAPPAQAPRAQNAPASALRPVDRLPALRQNDDYSCGTTSVAMLLSAWGKPTTKDQVNAAVRQGFLPSAPDDLTAYLRSRSMKAETKANATLEDLAREVEAGRPVVVLFDPISENSPKAKHDDVFLHYVAAQGVKRDASGTITHVSFRDPGDGRVHEVKAEDFMAAWTRLRVKNVDTGITRLMISAIPEGPAAASVKLPSNGPLGDAFHATRLGRVPMQGAADVFNGWVHARPGSIAGGLLKAIGGGLVGLPFMLGVSGLHALGWDGAAKALGAVGGAAVGAIGLLGGGIQAVGDGLAAGVKRLFGRSA